MSDQKPKRKIILPKRPSVETETVVIPAVQNLLDDGITIIGQELSRLRHKSNKGTGLDIKESKIVQGYLEALVKLSKESREHEKYEELDKLTERELLAEAAKAFGLKLVEDDDVKKAD